MRALLWKEYRQNRLTVAGIGGAIAVVLIVVRYTRYAEIGGLAFLGLLCFAAAALGGNAIASERDEGTLKFLFESPISRFKILLAKILFSLASFLAIGVLNIGIYILFYTKTIELPRPAPDIVALISAAIGAGVMAFIMALFFSVLFKNSLVSAIFGFALPLFYFLPLYFFKIGDGPEDIMFLLTGVYAGIYFLVLSFVIFCRMRGGEFSSFKKIAIPLAAIVISVAIPAGIRSERFLQRLYIDKVSRTGDLSYMFDISPDRQKAIFHDFDMKTRKPYIYIYDSKKEKVMRVSNIEGFLPVWSYDGNGFLFGRIEKRRLLFYRMMLKMMTRQGRRGEVNIERAFEKLYFFDMGTEKKLPLPFTRQFSGFIRLEDRQFIVQYKETKGFKEYYKDFYEIRELDSHGKTRSIETVNVSPFVMFYSASRERFYRTNYNLIVPGPGKHELEIFDIQTKEVIKRTLHLPEGKYQYHCRYISPDASCAYIWGSNPERRDERIKILYRFQDNTWAPLPPENIFSPEKEEDASGLAFTPDGSAFVFAHYPRSTLAWRKSRRFKVGIINLKTLKTLYLDTDKVIEALTPEEFRESFYYTLSHTPSPYADHRYKSKMLVGVSFFPVERPKIVHYPGYAATLFMVFDINSPDKCLGHFLIKSDERASVQFLNEDVILIRSRKFLKKYTLSTGALETLFEKGKTDE